MDAVVRGAITSASLIMAIGSQNAFILKNGILKNRTLLICSLCFACDFLLMSIGVSGVGTAIQTNAVFASTLAGCGALFLFFYGLRSFMAAFRRIATMDTGRGGVDRRDVGAVVAATLAVSLLNPHVYLDTVVIVGGIAGALDRGEKIQFLTGALVASCLWFFSLGYGARALAPLFRNPTAWRILEFVIGCAMWFIASGLVAFVFSHPG